jgi:hypothetical protein
LRVDTHAERDPPRRAEQVAEHRERMLCLALEQQSGTAGAQHAVAQLGHFQDRRDVL